MRNLVWIISLIFRSDYRVTNEDTFAHNCQTSPMVNVRFSISDIKNDIDIIKNDIEMFWQLKATKESHFKNNLF